MPRKSKKPVRKQTHSPTGKVVGQVGQILLPMIAGIAATKADLTEWVYEQGLTALHLLLREDAEEIAGLKGKHEKERTHNHCGSTNGELSFGGRRIQVSRPRVRSKSGEEASLPHFEAFREEDPLPERVLNQILVGVSTRNYESSLDKPAAKLKSRGTSKSAASRHLVSQTTKKLEEYLSRRLEEFELAALMLDGLEVAGQTVVVTLGITIDGTKVPLGIWLGSTENSRVCTAMLQDLLERGLRVDESILCVVDGGKGIRKALVDVLGDLAVIQRCQIHKLRNLRSYPRRVPLGDAVFNVGRALFTVEALRAGDYKLLEMAMADRLHQRHRLRFIPAGEAAMTAARKAGAAAVALSGAGPSLVAFAPDRHERIARAMARTLKGAGLKVRTFVLDIETEGARVLQPKEGAS